jgi:hypothetical protein
MAMKAASLARFILCCRSIPPIRSDLFNTV